MGKLGIYDGMPRKPYFHDSKLQDCSEFLFRQNFYFKIQNVSGSFSKLNKKVQTQKHGIFQSSQNTFFYDKGSEVIIQRYQDAFLVKS